jgi:2-methylcitrate dehydratase PrpD
MMRCIDHPTMLKDGSGWGAFAGVSAAYLAQDGFTGAPAITLEAPGQATLWSDLGSRSYVLEQYFKPYPVCRWAQPAVEAAAGLVRAHALAPESIARVKVETFAEAVRLGTAVPATTEAAQYALGFPLAAYLVRGRIGADEIGPAGLADPAIAAMTRRIVLGVRADLARQFPTRRLAVVRITRHDGTVVASPVTAARGDPDAPLADAELVDKFMALGTGRDADEWRMIAEACMAAGKGSASLAGVLDLVLSEPRDPPVEGRSRRPMAASTITA